MREKKDQLKGTNPKSESSTSSGKLVVVPYVKVLLEVTVCVPTKYDMTMSFRPASSIGQQLFKLRDKYVVLKMAGTIYTVGCKNCDKCYISKRPPHSYIYILVCMTEITTGRGRERYQLHELHPPTENRFYNHCV